MLTKRALIFSVLTFAMLLLSQPLLAQVETDITSINENPGNFVNENVVIEGLVTQYVPGSSNTVAYYILRDDLGSEIQVNTTIGAPNTNEKYRVIGVVYHENRRLFVSETSRESLATPLLLYFLIAGAVILLLVILVIVFSKNQSAENSSSQPSPTPEPAAAPAPATPADPPASDFFESGGEHTIVIDREYMTMKALPGKLVVLNGEQANKKLNLFGASSTEGTMITIGRNSPDWKKQLKPGREHAHIRIEDSTKTVSRLQAEFIYSDGKMKVKNLAQANPTLVDGNELGVGQAAILENGTIIEAGNVKLKYEL